MFTVMFTHPLGADFDPGLAVGLDQGEGVNLEGSGNLSWESLGSNLLALGLVVATLGLEFNASVAHNACRQHVAVKLLLSAEKEEKICFETFYESETGVALNAICAMVGIGWGNLRAVAILRAPLVLII